MISIFVPIVTYILLTQMPPFRLYKGRVNYRPLVAIAGFLFFISWYIPSPLIEGRDTSFMTHVLGGGIFSGFIWLYLVKTLQWRPKNIVTEAVSLYAFVSALGVLNELAELFLVKSGIVRLSLTDTSWDLVANTLGAFIFYLAYRMIRLFNAKAPRT